MKKLSDKASIILMIVVTVVASLIWAIGIIVMILQHYAWYWVAMFAIVALLPYYMLKLEIQALKELNKK